MEGKKHRKSRRKQKNREGAVLVLGAVLVILLIAAAVVIIVKRSSGGKKMCIRDRHIPVPQITYASLYHIPKSYPQNSGAESPAFVNSNPIFPSFVISHRLSVNILK